MPPPARQGRRRRPFRADFATSPRKRPIEPRVLARYRLAQPYIDRYLPNDSYKSLLLLMGLVMIGVALKGFFMFLQETLVASVMQLTLFDIRNVFFRRTINLDLASFSDQGSSELMTRFTNDMDSFGQGLNTLMSKVIREPLRFASCPRWSSLVQLATHLLDPDPGADLRRDDLPRWQDHEASGQTLAREHVHDLQDPPGELPGHQGGQGVLHRAGRAQAILRRDQEPVPQERASGDDRRHERPGPRNADAYDRGHRSAWPARTWCSTRRST